MSDLHGRLPPLPECDAVVIAGDVCPDYQRRGYYDHDMMRESQIDWLTTDFAVWEQTWPASVQYCGATWGNHDWVTQFPIHCRMMAYVDELVQFEDKRIWFTPWVSPCGAWNYQMCRDQRAQRFADIPYKVDLLVMHGPAYDCGDLTYSNESVGCREMRAVIQQKQPRYVVFGHIHEGQRYGREFRLGGSKCFNVAMWGAKWEPLVIEL